MHAFTSPPNNCALVKHVLEYNEIFAVYMLLAIYFIVSEYINYILNDL